jgi:hypothetical protein
MNWSTSFSSSSADVFSRGEVLRGWVSTRPAVARLRVLEGAAADRRSPNSH